MVCDSLINISLTFCESSFIVVVKKKLLLSLTIYSMFVAAMIEVLEDNTTVNDSGIPQNRIVNLKRPSNEASLIFHFFLLKHW
jgi:hypothetical protein